MNGEVTIPPVGPEKRTQVQAEFVRLDEATENLAKTVQSLTVKLEPILKSVPKDEIVEPSKKPELKEMKVCGLARTIRALRKNIRFSVRDLNDVIDRIEL